MSHGKKQARGQETQARQSTQDTKTSSNMGNGENAWAHKNASQEATLETDQAESIVGAIVRNE